MHSGSGRYLEGDLRNKNPKIYQESLLYHLCTHTITPPSCKSNLSYEMYREMFGKPFHVQKWKSEQALSISPLFHTALHLLSQILFFLHFIHCSEGGSFDFNHFPFYLELYTAPGNQVQYINGFHEETPASFTWTIMLINTPIYMYRQEG